jgi:hypothetical protein
MKRFHLLTAAAIAVLLGSGPALAQTTSAGGGGTGPAPTSPGTSAPAGVDQDLPVGSSHAVAEDQPPPPPPNEDEPPQIYDEDVPTKSDSIIFVCDISGSMDWGTSSYTGLDGNPTTGTKLDRMKVELIRAIQGLKDDFKFNIIAFDCDLRNWMPARVQATPANKASATGWVGRLRALGATGTGPAVCRALGEKDNFTVVLLTDGDPNCIGNRDAGIPEHKQMILAADTQGAVIHTFGIGAYGVFEQFLRDLANATGGRYVAVN